MNITMILFYATLVIILACIVLLIYDMLKGKINVVDMICIILLVVAMVFVYITHTGMNAQSVDDFLKQIPANTVPQSTESGDGVMIDDMPEGGSNASAGANGVTDNTSNTGNTDSGNTGATGTTDNTGVTSNTDTTGNTDNTGVTGNAGSTDNTGATNGTTDGEDADGVYNGSFDGTVDDAGAAGGQ